MNILYITNHLNIGGITSYVLTLSCGLKKKGDNIFIASSGGELLPRFLAQGIHYIHIPIRTKSEINPKIFVSLCKLLPQLKARHIEIIHVNSRTTQVLGCLLSGLSGIPYISTCHGFFKTRLSRKIFPCWGRRVIAISESVKEHLVEDFKVNAQKAVIVHHGIDVERFRDNEPGAINQLRSRFGLREGPVIGIIARLSDVKGHAYLMQAMREILENIPLAQLLIAGDGPMKRKLMDEAKNLGIAKNTIFITSTIDTKEVLSTLDLFVMPSLAEGLGLALMEAMAWGLPVIGSNVGGIKNLIQHGKNGLLVPPADSQSLASAILALLNNQQMAQTLGQKARDFIMNNFSQEKMVDETERVYQECLGVSP